VNPLSRHEKTPHVGTKVEVDLRCTRADFITFFELGRSDVLICKRRPDGSWFTNSMEVQTSTRHLCENIRRNIANGIERTCFVATSQAVKRAIQRKLKKLQLDPGHRVSVITLVQPNPTSVNSNSNAHTS